MSHGSRVWSGVAAVLLVGAFHPPRLAGEAWEPAAFYAANCAPCHGMTGRLSAEHPNYENFESPPADLTDPLFNSREPRADWELVVAHGGKPLGLSNQMPAFGEAMTGEQITRLVEYLKTLADAERFPPGDLNFLRAIDTIKAFPEDEALWITRYEDRPTGDDARANTLYYARRFGARFQGEAKIRYLDQADRQALDEFELGFKWAMYDDLSRELLLTSGVELAIPLEDDDAVEELIPYFSVAQGLGTRFTLQGSARLHLPTDDAGDGDVKLSSVVHWMPSVWPRSGSPGLEVTVTRPFDGDLDLEATLLPQLYVGLSRGGHVALAVGVEIPLTDLEYDYRIHGFLLWDIADGPFWRGW